MIFNIDLIVKLSKNEMHLKMEKVRTKNADFLNLI